MYCPNCGKELPEGSRFCPSCGKECAPGQPGTPPPAPTKPASTVTLNVKTLLIAAAVVIVVLLAVLILRPGQSAEQSQNGPAQTAAPTPTPDPAAALVGTWTNKNGVGLRFTSDGTLKLSGFGLSLGGDTFTYEVTGENTLTLTATVGGVLSADIVAPYAIRGNTLVIELSGIELTLTRN